MIASRAVRSWVWVMRKLLRLVWDSGGSDSSRRIRSDGFGHGQEIGAAAGRGTKPVPHPSRLRRARLNQENQWVTPTVRALRRSRMVGAVEAGRRSAPSVGYSMFDLRPIRETVWPLAQDATEMLSQSGYLGANRDAVFRRSVELGGQLAGAAAQRVHRQQEQQFRMPRTEPMRPMPQLRLDAQAGLVDVPQVNADLGGRGLGP